MEYSKLSTKGQIVIPKELRERHGWAPGTELMIEDRGDAVILRAAKPFPETRVEDGVGCTGYRGPPKSVEEMNAGIDAALRRDWGLDDDP